MRQGRGGWMLTELLILLVIVSIIYCIFLASYDALQARLRFNVVKANMDAISKAAFVDFTSSKDHVWAPMVAPGSAPSFTASHLSKWPEPPCPGWMYGWDNYYGVATVKAVRVTVYQRNGHALWSICLENYGGDCEGADMFGDSPTELSKVTDRYVYCNE